MSNEKTRALLIDGNSVLCNSYFATLKPDSDVVRSVDGRPSNAIYLFMQNVLQLISAVRPTHFMISWDAPHNFRKDLYPNYKANRPPKPEDLKSQIEDAPHFVKDLGLKQLRFKNLEGDDTLATMADCCKKNGIDEIFVVTGDRDLFQLADDKVSILYYYSDYRTLINRFDLDSSYMYPCSIKMDTKTIPLYTGVPAHKIVDWKSLAGDSGDNIPGLKGISEESSAKLLEEFGTMDDIFKARDTMTPDEFKERCKKASRTAFNVLSKEDSKENAEFYRKLVTVAVGNHSRINLDDYRLHLKKNVLCECFKKWKFFKLIQHFNLEADGQSNAPSNVSQKPANETKNELKEEPKKPTPTETQPTETKEAVKEEPKTNTVAPTPSNDASKNSIFAVFGKTPAEEEDLCMFQTLMNRISKRYTGKEVYLGQSSTSLGTVTNITLELTNVLGNDIVNVVLHTDKGVDYPIIRK